MAMALDPDPAKPATVVGLGCHPSPAIALTKAVFELCQGRPSEARRFADKPPQGRLARYEDVRTLDDHSAFASLAERRDEFTFLWRHGSRARIADLPDPSLGSVGADLARCAERLAMLGCRVAYAELTTSDVAGRGFHVVRVIATQLQPIHFGHGQERLGGHRLYELPQRLGLADAPTSADALNPCPHPLA
jgi:ribosomal protein S12 methylthiotransferase accessory factor